MAWQRLQQDTVPAVSFYIKKGETVIDVVADTAALANRSPNLAAKFDNIEGVRKEHDELSVWTNWGRRYGGTGEYKHLARIPDGVMSALLAVKPDFLQDRKAFYKWLNRHPEYRATPKPGA